MVSSPASQVRKVLGWISGPGFSWVEFACWGIKGINKGALDFPTTKKTHFRTNLGHSCNGILIPMGPA